MSHFFRLAALLPTRPPNCWAALALMMLTVAGDGPLVADDRWRMIEQDEFSTGDASLWVGPVERLPHQAGNGRGITWSAAADFVGLSRADDHELRWVDNYYYTTHSAEVGTDLNSGVRLSVIREQSDVSDHAGSVLGFSFLTVSGEGQTEVYSDLYETSSDLISLDLNFGGTRELLGGRSASALGVRYLNMSDQYDVTPLGYLPKIVEAIETQNHVYVMQGTISGLWRWRRVLFEAALAGGFGAAQSHQQGLWFNGPAVRFDQTETKLSTLAELNANVALELTERTRVRVGLQGLTVTNVVMSRHAYFKPGEPGGVAYLGMTFGLSHLF